MYTKCAKTFHEARAQSISYMGVISQISHGLTGLTSVSHISPNTKSEDHTTFNKGFFGKSIAS
jgi:hypothetical protein